MKKVKLVIALFVSTLLVSITAISKSASAKVTTVTSLPGSGTASTWLSLGDSAYLSGVVCCSERVSFMGNPCSWSASLYGELAILHEEAEAAFGYNGSIDNEMPRSRFVRRVYGSYVESFSRSASMFTFIKEKQGATVTLYY